MVSKWKKGSKHTGTAVDSGDALIIGKHKRRVNEPSASGDPRKRPDGKPRTGCGSYLYADQNGENASGIVAKCVRTSFNAGSTARDVML
jgi:hypothetical protein